MKATSFKDLEVWKESLSIIKEVYDLTSQPRFSKDFGLRDQIQRAVVSISSNIVEGFEKNNNNEFSRYLRISKGSLGEVRNLLEISRVIGYISDKTTTELDDRLVVLSRQIGALLNYLQKLRNGGTIQK